MDGSDFGSQTLQADCGHQFVRNLETIWDENRSSRVFSQRYERSFMLAGQVLRHKNRGR